MTDVEKIIRGIAKEAINELRPAILEEIRKEFFHDDVLISRKEAAERLEVDLSTLWRWRDSYLKPIKKGGRVYYKLSEVEARCQGVVK